MDCPVCKYPNPSGATHCGMCYEVFNRSAAQSYLHAVKRERRMNEGNPAEPEAIIKTQHVLEEVKANVAVVDWQGILDRIIHLFKKSQKTLILVAGLVVVWMVVSYLFSAGLWYHLLGKKFVYSFSEKTPVQYLVGMKSTVKSWSERNGRLDTPMEHFKVDEIGNVLLEKKKNTNKKNKNSMVSVRTKEWIQFTNDTGGPMSRTLSNKHPSLADARVVLDKKGVVLERRLALSPRLAKSVPFLFPRFPTGHLHQGRQWTEETEWLDVYNDWQIRWKGTLHWTLGELVPCGKNTCAKLTYTAELEPRWRGGPGWTNGNVHRVDATASGEGEVMFDAAHKRLVSNTFTYDGLLHFPIDNLARIPRELRIGRRVKGPGEIILRFENKIDLRIN